MAITWKKVAYEANCILKTVLAAEGDILYASSANVPAALNHGSEGNVLTVASGLPAWAAPAAPAAHTLNSHTVPSGAVDFDLQQATDLVTMTVAAEINLPAGAGTVAKGQLCWATSEATLHICTAAS